MNKYFVNFKLSESQSITKNSIVTYLDETRMSIIKDHLLIKSDFFVVKDQFEENVTISNGIDTIISTKDQLLVLDPFLEELMLVDFPSFNTGPLKYLKDTIKLKEMEELKSCYPIKDPYMGILAAGLIIGQEDFVVEKELESEVNGKKRFFAYLIPDRIFSYL